MNPNQQKTPRNIATKKPLHKGSGTADQNSFELILNWYKINGKNLAGEERLVDLHMRKLLNILGNPLWNQLYHCWNIELKHMTDLQPYVSHQFNPDKFVYFIEAYNSK